MSKTQLMAILNITKDSFYPASRTLDPSEAVERALKMQAEGADLIDIGGESTRPGADQIDTQEEMARVVPVIKALRTKLSIPISIDTSKPAVAMAALQAGADWINDVTGFSNPEMVALAAQQQADLVLMHMQGTPKTMQTRPHYPEGIMAHLMHWFENRVALLMSHGVKSERIILDPGIGFGKTVDDNLKIIHNLSEFKRLGFRILLGISRKSFLGRIANRPTEELLPATLAINSVAILSQTDIIRVHDVQEHRAAIDAIQAYMKAKP